MILKTIAIDGACRRNGQASCLSAGACFIITYNDEDDVVQGATLSIHEEHSTSQRGELNGLLMAVEHVSQAPTETIIITDSEYIFNTMTKGWIPRWNCNGWTTKDGSSVKNQDLWRQIWALYEKCQDCITFLHIKGHLLTVGAKKSRDLLYHDTTGFDLYYWVLQMRTIREDKYARAQELSAEVNGFEMSDLQLKQYAAMNLVADAVANITLEILESAQWQAILNNSSPSA